MNPNVMHRALLLRKSTRSLSTVVATPFLHRRSAPLAGIEDLREKREEVNRSILRDEEEKAAIQKQLTVLTERLSRINEDLARKLQARNEFDQTIQETEGAYMKVRRVLVHVASRSRGCSSTCAQCPVCHAGSHFVLLLAAWWHNWSRPTYYLSPILAFLFPLACTMCRFWKALKRC